VPTRTADVLYIIVDIPPNKLKNIVIPAFFLITAGIKSEKPFEAVEEVEVAAVVDI
jgi:hypothetical protein